MSPETSQRHDLNTYTGCHASRNCDGCLRCVSGLLYPETVTYGWRESKQVECIISVIKYVSWTRAGVATLFLFETEFLGVDNYPVLPDYGARNVASSSLS